MHNGEIERMIAAAPESEASQSHCSGSNSTEDLQTTEVIMSDHDDDGGHDVSESTNDPRPEMNCNGSLCCPPDAMQKSSLFLLRLKVKHKLTQVTVQSIVDNVTTLTQQRISSLKSQVHS